MIVVADTSPINYLLQIGCDHLLQQLYDRVAIPLTVMNELRAPRAPEVVRRWAQDLPLWVDALHAHGPFRHELLSLDPANEKPCNSP